MFRNALFLTESPYGQPAALLRGDAFAPLIVFGDRLLVDNSFGHETNMQPRRTFGKRGSSDAYKQSRYRRILFHSTASFRTRLFARIYVGFTASRRRRVGARQRSATAHC